MEISFQLKKAELSAFTRCESQGAPRERSQAKRSLATRCYSSRRPSLQVFQMRLHPMLVLVLLLASAASAAEGPTATTTTLYKSTGPDGRTIYSDRPQPQAQISKTLTFKNLPGSPLSVETLAYVEQLRKSADARASAPPPRDTVLFFANWCGYCRQAKAYLAARNIGYRGIDIDTAEGKLAYAQLGGNNGVPQLYVNGQGVTGFTADAYDAFFKSRK
ncbi:glutaredoxin domain-containing protein [Variovorax sp. VaC1]|uniref:glutaredoxin domain-containing protein n=1 Tax=Variovorax sp. VaC1 TaxID=3373132 RepID=UPI00374A5E64